MRLGVKDHDFYRKSPTEETLRVLCNTEHDTLEFKIFIETYHQKTLTEERRYKS